MTRLLIGVPASSILRDGDGADQPKIAPAAHRDSYLLTAPVICAKPLNSEGKE
jgi:hypothetical protein